jgi:hypothetical protein
MLVSDGKLLRTLRQAGSAVAETVEGGGDLLSGNDAQTLIGNGKLTGSNVPSRREITPMQER